MSILPGDPMIASLNVDFTISLESNPTTGYVWEALFDSAFLALKKKDFRASDAKSVGSGGIEIFTFLPIRTGKTVITMVHKRPWESGSLEERKFPLEIVHLGDRFKYSELERSSD